MKFEKCVMRIIESTRLILEPQVAAHADEMFSILNDPALYEHENEAPSSIEWLGQRFAKLETRKSTDGSEQWLNWVIRLPKSGLIGYVQATVSPSLTAGIAYVLSSRFWGQGFATEAVKAMISELVTYYGVQNLSAVLKRSNIPSERLLSRVGFLLASAEDTKAAAIEHDEILMVKTALKCDEVRASKLEHL